MKLLGGLLSRRRSQERVENIEREIKDALSRTPAKSARATSSAQEAELAPWLELLRHEDSDQRTAAAEELARKGEAAVPFLIDVLEDAYGGARASAAYALGKSGDRRAVEPLISKLQDENESVRVIVVLALSRIADPRAVEPLVGSLTDPYAKVRSMAAAALLELDDASAVTGLIPCLRDEDREVRKMAALALGKLGDNRAVEPLIERMTAQEKVGEIQLIAVIGLGELGDPRAVAPLSQALAVGDSTFRSAAADALGKLGDTEAVEPLLGALGDLDPLVRRMAAKSLGALEDGRAVPTLEATLEDEDSQVQDEVRKALAILADQRVEPADANAGISAPAAAPSGGKPTFKGKNQKGKNTYENYEADDAQAARTFLLTQKVDKPLYYINVETPEGVWGLDKDGLYLIHLQPWQTDLSLAQCEGSMVEHPSTASVQMATQIAEVDNVMAKVRCGHCEAEWFDGLRYQELTIVRCPHCRYHNKVDSSHVRSEF